MIFGIFDTGNKESGSNLSFGDELNKKETGLSFGNELNKRNRIIF
jgi:hypothetical protein